MVCRGFAPPPGFQPSALGDLLRAGEAAYPAAQDGAGMRRLVPFLACGDLSGWDADQSYDLPGSNYTPLDPVQPPTAPAYKEAIERARRAAGGGGAGAV